MSNVKQHCFMWLNLNISKEYLTSIFETWIWRKWSLSQKGVLSHHQWTCCTYHLSYAVNVNWNFRWWSDSLVQVARHACVYVIFLIRLLNGLVISTFLGSTLLSSSIQSFLLPSDGLFGLNWLHWFRIQDDSQRSFSSDEHTAVYLLLFGIYISVSPFSVSSFFFYS